MRRGESAKETTKKVIDVIKIKPRVWSEIKEETKISDKTLERILDNLTYWGLANQEEDGHWSWFDRFITYETHHELIMALKHSRQLLTAESLFCASLKDPALITETDRSPLEFKEKALLARMIDAHIKTGYRELSPKIDDFSTLMRERRDLLDQIRKMKADYKIGDIEKPEHIPDALENIVHWGFPHSKDLIPREYRKNIESLCGKIRIETLNRIKEVEYLTNKAFIMLTAEVQLMSLKVKNGDPLRGVCKLCPTVRVRQEKNLRPSKEAGSDGLHG